jgi:tetratricopeptide (TPR) repeat protein
MRRRVNYRALLMLAAAGAALTVGTHFLHAVQVSRHARALSEQAEQAEHEGAADRAAGYLEQFLGFAPHDADARAKYGLLLNRRAAGRPERQRAFLELEQALRDGSRRPEVRRQAAELALGFGRYAEAREYLTDLLSESPKDADLLRLLGTCELGAAQPAQAAEYFTRAAESAPGRVEVCTEAAAVLRYRLNRDWAADKVIEQMVDAAPKSAPARLAAARYFGQAKNWERAAREVRVALDELKSRDADLLLLAAEVAQAQGRAAEARGHLEEGVRLHPRDPRLALALARIDVRDRQPEQARGHLAAALREAPKRPDELFDTAEVLIELGDLDKANDLIRRLHESGATWAADYLRGRVQMRQRAWAEARATLEKVAADPQARPEYRKQVHLLLAECHAQLHNPDQQLLAYRQALKIDGRWLPARRGLAATLAALGKLDEAVAEYRALVGEAPELGAELARLLVARNRRLPAAQRDWAEVDRLLRGLPDKTRDAPDVRLLRADILLAQDQPDAARKLLEAERDRDPQQVAPWLALAALAERDGRPDAALAVLAEAERRAGRRVEWELAKAQHWLRVGGAEAAEQLRQIEAAAGQRPEADRGRLWSSLAAAYLALGDRAAARRLARQVAGRESDNLPVRFQLLEMALQDGDAAEAERLVGEVRRLEGAGGPLGSYGEAAYQTLLAGRGDKDAPAKARQALARAADQRPSWPRVPALEATLYELEGRKDKALEKYQEALGRGEGRLAVVQRVLQLLGEQHRYAEAQELIRKLPEPALARTGLGRVAAELTLAGLESDGGPDPAPARARALQQARRTVAADSRNYRDFLWLGQMAALAGQAGEAEQAFRRARDLAEAVPDTWIVLVQFLSRIDAKKAEAELEAAKARPAKDLLPVVLAPCYESLGRPGPAAEQYQLALAARPGDPNVLRAAASFYSRTGQPARAQPLLRTLTDPATKAPEATAAWARRTLALSLPVMGDYQQFREAVALIEANGTGDTASAEDRLAKAVLLALQPAHRKEAIQLFEGLAARKGAVPPDARFLLAQLYERDGNWPRAQAQMLALLGEYDANPIYLAYYARGLLDRRDADGARVWVDKLAALRPEAFETAELRARVLKAQGRDAEAARVVQEYAARPEARLDAAAALLDELGRTADAEEMYRRFVATSKRPEAALALAQFLARHGRASEALALCEAAWATCPPEAVANASVAVLRVGRGTDEQCQRVEDRLTAARQRAPQSALLPVLLAELQEVRGRHDEAQRIYREILRANPHHVVALNNLAYLLALTGGPGDEALRLVQAAIDRAGPVAELLDTRAVVHLTAGRAGPAGPDQRQAGAPSPAPSATAYFHLARAYHLAQNPVAALDAYRKAAGAGLRAEDLHPLERPAFRELTAALGQD